MTCLRFDVTGLAACCWALGQVLNGNHTTFGIVGSVWTHPMLEAAGTQKNSNTKRKGCKPQGCMGNFLVFVSLSTRTMPWGCIVRAGEKNERELTATHMDC